MLSNIYIFLTNSLICYYKTKYLKIMYSTEFLNLKNTYIF